jgi:hypothetical protein
MTHLIPNALVLADFGDYINRTPASLLAWEALGVVVVLAGIIIFFIMLPELIRYMKISSM